MASRSQNRCAVAPVLLPSPCREGQTEIPAHTQRRHSSKWTADFSTNG